MKKKYNLTLHLTPELRSFVGISSRGTWKYQHHWRGSALEGEADKFGWHNISHVLVEDGLTKKQALEMRTELIGASGCIGLNQRAFADKDNGQQKQMKMKKDKQTTMMASNANGVKLSLTFDNRYLSKNGYPVVIRVYKDRQWAYVPTGFSMTADEFKSVSGESLKALESKFNRVKEWCVKSVDEGVFSLKAARSCLREKEDVSTLAGLIELKMQTLANQATKRSYISAMSKVREMWNDGLEVRQVTPEALSSMMNWMLSDGLSGASVNIYMSAVKASINYAIYKGLFDEKRYPFKKNAWECDKVTLPKSAKRQDRWISLEEMREIWDKFKETKNKWLGLFLFSYLTGGMNLADMMDLKFTREWVSKKTLRFVRKKTAHKVSEPHALPVSSHVTELLSILGIEEKEGEMVFPFLEGEYFSRKGTVTRMIVKAMEKYGFNISMTYARHSFCVIATKNKMPASMVEQAMCHTNNGVSSHYMTGWDVDDMREEFEKLL